MLFSFFSIDAKTKKNLGVNKIVMMIGFLGKFFFFDYEIFFSTPGIDSCAYFFFKLKQHFHFFLFTREFCSQSVSQQRFFFIISTQQVGWVPIKGGARVYIQCLGISGERVPGWFMVLDDTKYVVHHRIWHRFFNNVLICF